MIRDLTEKVAKAWREEAHGHRKLYSGTVPVGSELMPWKDWRPCTSFYTAYLVFRLNGTSIDERPTADGALCRWRQRRPCCSPLLQ